jgi:hypothetical protein
MVVRINTYVRQKETNLIGISSEKFHHHVSDPGCVYFLTGC